MVSVESYFQMIRFAFIPIVNETPIVLMYCVTIEFSISLLDNVPKVSSWSFISKLVKIYEKKCYVLISVLLSGVW